jgi:8-oxo-dGTP pyrophosphatase MutT (NUDIX family)
MVVVHRRAPALEVLLLHRSGLGEHGDWAWTPPSGARFPAEPIDECAARELHEETGLDASPVRLPAAGTARWWVYGLEVEADAVIGAGQEHDRHEWVPPEEAVRRCRPEAVRASVLAAVAHLAR